MVRQSLAIDFEGFTYPELFLIASTDFPFEKTLTGIAYVNYIADPFEWLVLLRVPGLWRVLVPARRTLIVPSFYLTGRCRAFCSVWCRAPSPTPSRTVRSIMCTRGSRKISVVAASFSRGSNAIIASLSTIASAA